MSIFVGNLPFRAEQEDVVELFAQFGEVVNCALPLERDTGRKRGFAFVEMADEATEEAAIEGLQGAELMGRPLRINKAEPRGSAPRRGGGGGGYGGSDNYGGSGGGDNFNRRPGDWDCPACGAQCFGSKNFCYRCNAPKPEGLDGGMGGELVGGGGQEW